MIENIDDIDDQLAIEYKNKQIVEERRAMDKYKRNLLVS